MHYEYLITLCAQGTLGLTRVKVGNPHTYLCTDNLDCMFDAKRIPARGEKQNFWLYRWGFGQNGITPGHVQLQLVWFQK